MEPIALSLVEFLRNWGRARLGATEDKINFAD